MKTPQQIIAEQLRREVLGPNTIADRIISALAKDGYAFVQAGGFRGLTIEHEVAA